MSKQEDKNVSMAQWSASHPIFKPNPKTLNAYIGNIRKSGDSAEYYKLKEFLNIYFDEWIITVEAKGRKGEHCHFWACKCKLESVQQRVTLAAYFIKYIPSLKRSGQGGDNKYHLSELKEEYQFYYIFKEQKDANLVVTKGSWISDKDVKEYREQYFTIHKAKKNGALGEFHLYCLDNMTTLSLKKRGALCDNYMEWTLKVGKSPSLMLCERYVNHLLNIYDHFLLRRSFREIIVNKYNKAYF